MEIEKLLKEERARLLQNFAKLKYEIDKIDKAIAIFEPKAKSELRELFGLPLTTDPKEGKNRKHHSWTPKEIETLSELKDTPISKIAKQLGRTKKAVRVMACKKGITGMSKYATKSYTRKGWTPEETERMYALLKDGVSTEQISYILGRTKGSVEQRIYRLQKPMSALKRSKRNIWTNEEEQMLTGMWKSRYPIKSIATRLNLGKIQIQNKISTLGLRR